MSWWVTNGNRFSSNPKLGKLMFWWMQKYFPMQLDFLAKVQRILAMSNFTPLFTHFRSNSQSVLFNATPNLKHSGIFATSTCVAILKTVTLNFQHTITPTLSIGLDLFRLIALEWTMLCVRNENTFEGKASLWHGPLHLWRNSPVKPV